MGCGPENQEEPEMGDRQRRFGEQEVLQFPESAQGDYLLGSFREE